MKLNYDTLNLQLLGSQFKFCLVLANSKKCNTVNSVIYAGKIFMLIHHFEPNFIYAQ